MKGRSFPYFCRVGLANRKEGLSLTYPLAQENLYLSRPSFYFHYLATNIISVFHTISNKRKTSFQHATKPLSDFTFILIERNVLALNWSAKISPQSLVWWTIIKIVETNILPRNFYK
jgi:hypothetical protein